MKSGTSEDATMSPYDFARMRKVVDSFEEDDEDDGATVCDLRLCLDVTLYYERPFKENDPGLLHFYERSLELIGDHVRYALIDGKGRFKKATKKTLDLLPFWLSDEAADRPVHGLTLESGAAPGDMSDRAFQLFQSDIAPGYVRLVLPLEFLEPDPARFVALAADLARDLEFLSGSGGFAVNMDPDYPSWMEDGHVYKISRRFLGIDFGKPHLFADFMTEGIKCVNWLTFLGSPLLERLGGREHLETALGPGMRIFALRHGVMIQAGPVPGFGAVNKRELLPDYRRVGSVLKPVRIPEDVLDEYDEIGGSENTSRWLARFD